MIVNNTVYVTEDIEKLVRLYDGLNLVKIGYKNSPDPRYKIEHNYVRVNRLGWGSKDVEIYICRPGKIPQNGLLALAGVSGEEFMPVPPLVHKQLTEYLGLEVYWKEREAASAKAAQITLRMRDTRVKSVEQDVAKLTATIKAKQSALKTHDVTIKRANRTIARANRSIATAEAYKKAAHKEIAAAQKKLKELKKNG